MCRALLQFHDVQGEKGVLSGREAQRGPPLVLSPICPLNLGARVQKLRTIDMAVKPMLPARARVTCWPPTTVWTLQVPLNSGAGPPGAQLS